MLYLHFTNLIRLAQTYRQGPAFPNASHYGSMRDQSLLRVCGDGRDNTKEGCLFNIFRDQGESKPRLAEMMISLHE
jgi:hypothetical protein